MIRKGQSMSFLLSYQKALTLQSNSPQESLPESAYFAGVFYEPCEATVRQLPTVLSGGGIEISSEMTLSYQPLDCRMLLYTKEGGGLLSTRGKAHALQAGSLLYLDCSSTPFSLKAEQLPWRYIVFLLQGGLLPFMNPWFPLTPFCWCSRSRMPFFSEMYSSFLPGILTKI